MNDPHKSVRRDISQPSFCFGEDCLPHQDVTRVEIVEQQEGRHLFTTASVKATPSDKVRWDFHAETVLYGKGELVHTGVCVKSTMEEDGAVTFSLHGPFWELGQATINNLEIFGMSNKEIMYWMPQLTGLVRGVTVEGLELDTQLRPFLYAVPLNGLTAREEPRSFFVKDFGVTAGDKDNTFAPLLAKTQTGLKEPVWHQDVPKAWGVVFATDILQAERRALDRAQFTADLISFALRAGVSHFETRHRADLLLWDVKKGRSTVSLHPWILLCEVKSVKGWIRSIPLVETRSTIDLSEGYDRIKLFSEHFLEASWVGDVQDQAGRRELSKRERQLATGTQRSLRWYGIAANEPDINDQFIATWVSLESILDSIEYPGVFAKERAEVRNSIQKKFKDIQFPESKEELLRVTPNLLEGRLLQNDWPLRRKLEIFAKAFGITLRSGDVKLINDLGRLRGKILHAGRDDAEISKEQLRKLQYLVERLLMAASTGGYRDIEDDIRHKLEFSKIGPEGSAVPLALDGRAVSYRFRLFRDKQGQQASEYVVEATVYDETNSDTEFRREN